MRKAKLNYEINFAGVGVYQSVYELLDARTGEQLAFEVKQHPRKTRKGVLAYIKRKVAERLADGQYYLDEEEAE